MSDAPILVIGAINCVYMTLFCVIKIAPYT